MTVLDKIVAVKEHEVAALRCHADALQRSARARTDHRDFAAALRRTKGVALIAEVKKASPSAGVIRPDFDPVRIAVESERAGASALSVLTDEQFFQGRLHYLASIRQRVALPLLRKDFVIDELQIYEAAAHGADAILLIVAILNDAQLLAFQRLADELKLAALVEVHDAAELDRALAVEARVIGINNRNLNDFSVSLDTTRALCARLAGESTTHTIVAESGIHTRADVEAVAAAGVNAILVGESLMRSQDIAAKVRELLDRN